MKAIRELKKIEDDHPHDRMRNRGRPVHGSRLRWLRLSIGFTIEEAAAAADLDERQIRRFESDNVCVDAGTLDKIARAYRRHPEFLVRKKAPLMPIEDPIGAAFRYWILLAGRKMLHFGEGQDLREALHAKPSEVFRKLAPDDVDVLLVHLVCRGYLDLDDKGRFLVIERKPYEVLAQRVHRRIGMERDCVEWSFDPSRRRQLQPVVLDNMRSWVSRMRALLAPLSDGRPSHETTIDVLQQVYTAEPECHVEKAGPDGEMREEMAMKLAARVRVRHDHLTATADCAELMGRRLNLRPFVNDALTMIDEHEGFIRLAESGASVPELCGYDRQHALKVLDHVKKHDEIERKIMAFRNAEQKRRVGE